MTFWELARDFGHWTPEQAQWYYDNTQPQWAGFELRSALPGKQEAGK